ncbi:transcriptional regulator [Lactobacillus jensenii]|uniref:Transcriptional regulator n=1 Tax=Lactobacillus mulieris TaxID=2508708 RepID=A0AAP3GXA5_9LACO|nr:MULTISPECIES: transcriptional regulator [Lactobacillus]MCW8088531.1 transcriptional regulator [Lactobacillus jensenii]MCZ3845171.1 transcriptional regulator [Lactobacillus mulieris]MCZ3900389.1 transcriptional regulator [Lactobacillus mulieris]MCZ9641341.1 transcriptional regulator [Lactobacillus jensenii]MDK6563818.1 transcriptional regulator [Lactobacillus mulieris]
MNEDKLLKSFEKMKKYEEEHYPEIIQKTLAFWKRKHDAGRVPDEYYEKTREALLKSLDDWNKRHGKS